MNIFAVWRRGRHLLSVFRKKPFASGIVLLIVIVFTAWILFFIRNGSNGEETMIVQAGEFLQQVSVSGKVVAEKDVRLGFSQGGRGSRLYAAVGGGGFSAFFLFLI